MIMISLVVAVLEERWEVIERLTRAPRWPLVTAIVTLMLFLRYPG
jgi:hypothetical protein